jgi:site-specific recombinase XerD
MAPLEIRHRSVRPISAKHAQASRFLQQSRTGQLSDTPLTRQDARAMVRRRADAAGIGTKIGNHTFRATGITSFLKNGGTLERAAQMANHSSTRTTQLYDRRHDEMSLDDVERIGI